MYERRDHVKNCDVYTQKFDNRGLYCEFLLLELCKNLVVWGLCCCFFFPLMTSETHPSDAKGCVLTDKI